MSRPTRIREFEQLERSVVSCRRCPRLVEFREKVPPRAAFRSQEYWRKPIPGFGDPDAWLMVLGLAPAAHGGNRTGRVFTGDESAKFLVRCLHRAGFANQPVSVSRDDGLVLRGCYIAAAARCVPPDNKPTRDELGRCRPFLEREFELLTNLRAVLALGQVAFRAYADIARNKDPTLRGVHFRHGARIKTADGPWLYCSYHPSPRNTYTGKLSEPMLAKVLETAKADWPSEASRALRRGPAQRVS